ncbi:hypothetical protein A1QO_02750 [Vibrio genomosp. F10 str. ZF-129]|uniref:Uncharacterized protein n=1 Tax=Vibrio genomosp. F10 str. ZF-129 TaxID=1187848 RepID=A0A1E5BKB6_9VIBR|nr:hypothetical protein [Vibrio genomosp. F10]OEE38317.1 hypothetical protein A1QO_02750 [Vibrio genomosp. F10 str. ZF-129]
MLSLYKVKSHQLSFLEQNLMFPEIEASFLKLLANFLVEYLKLDRTDITAVQVDAKLTQASRKMFIGSNILTERFQAKDICTHLLVDLIRQTDDIKKSAVSVKTHHIRMSTSSCNETTIRIDLGRLVARPHLTIKIHLDRVSSIICGPAQLTLEIGVQFYGDKNLGLVELIKVDTNSHVPKELETLLSYYDAINAQGIEHALDGWNITKFNEDQSHRLIVETLKASQHGFVDESDWREISKVVMDYVIFIEFCDLVDFDESVRYLTGLGPYFFDDYEYDAAGHSFGRTVALSILQTNLMLSDSPEKLAIVAHQLVSVMETDDIYGDVEQFLDECMYFSSDDCYEISDECRATREQFLKLVQEEINEEMDW